MPSKLQVHYIAKTSQNEMTELGTRASGTAAFQVVMLAPSDPVGGLSVGQCQTLNNWMYFSPPLLLLDLFGRLPQSQLLVEKCLLHCYWLGVWCLVLALDLQVVPTAVLELEN